MTGGMHVERGRGEEGSGQKIGGEGEGIDEERDRGGVDQNRRASTEKGEEGEEGAEAHQIGISTQTTLCALALACKHIHTILREVIGRGHLIHLT